MEYVDFTTNTDYYDKEHQVMVIGIEALDIYTHRIRFQTEVDEAFSGNEQRRAQWTNPKMEWNLEFQKTPVAGKKFRDFFIKMKGRFRAFRFIWRSKNRYGENTGGDDKWHTVRFKEDELRSSVDHLGYSSFRIGVIEVGGDEVVRQ